MGYFWEGIPPYLLPQVSRILGNDATSVETGTFRGDSALLFANTFGSCTTIERSVALGKQAKERFAQDSRITVLVGSSRDLLTQALPSHDHACFFWLDAHGVYDTTGADSEENPLLAELEVITEDRSPSNTVIAIDDARGMGTQPGWPSIGSICARLANEGYDIIFLDDILLAFDRASGLDTYATYQAGRQTQVPMLFHLWPNVQRLFRVRRKLDGIVSRLRE